MSTGVMLRALLFAAAVLCGSASALAAPDGPEGDGATWKQYARALADAKTSRRIVLVDVYTNWCGWCKKMDKDVYADPRVAKVLAERFEIVKLNAESAASHDVDGRGMTERQIASSFGVRSYPTTVFLDADATIITAVPGYIPADSFLDVLEYIAGEFYKTTSWNAFLESKKKD